MQFCQVMFFIFIKIVLQRFAKNYKQHFSGLWFVAVIEEQALTWVKVDPYLFRLMVSLWTMN